MKVSVIQPRLTWEDKQTNFRLIEELARPLTGNTDLVILPEMFSTGFSMNTGLAEEHYGSTFEWLKRQSANGNYAICGSYIVREDTRILNRFVFVTASEDHFYDKRHLFSPGDEDKSYDAGRERIIFNYREFRISPFICYDLRFPVWSRNHNDYDLAIYVSSWPAARAHTWDTLLMARAIENQCYVAGSNRIGTDGNNVAHIGSSQVINPRGEVIVSAGNDEKVITADLSLEDLIQFREKFNIIKDADEFELVL